MKSNNQLVIREDILSGVLARQPGNPRNSEGSFLTLQDGRIVFAYSQYFGNSDNDHAPCSIAAIYSADGGKSFDTEHPEILVYAADYGEQNVMSVTLRYMNNGDIGLFYILKRAGNTTEYLMRRYSGDFSHFLGEVKCLPGNFDGYFVVNNDRVLHLSDGRWMIPAALHQTAMGQPGNDYFDGRAAVYFFVSEDDGRTWKQQREVLQMADTYTATGLQEPGLAELPGGVLYCYSRTDRLVQYESVSIDGGDHWFQPQPSQFTSPVSPMLIKRNPHSGLYYAVWNPTPTSPMIPSSVPWWGRTPFVIAQSRDGVHFSEPVLLETDPTRGYCYPALLFLDEKTALLSYCSGGAEEGCCLTRTMIRRLVFE